MPKSIKCVFYLFLLISLTTAAFGQTTNSPSEDQMQLLMVTEIETLRSKVTILTSTVNNLESQLKNTNDVVTLKNQQLEILTLVITEYKKLSDIYNQQITFYKSIIDNNQSIINSHQQLAAKNGFLEKLKLVLYTIVGIVIGRGLN